MRIAIIGAGFTGLSAAYDLSKAGHQVSVFESENIPGGLASGFSSPGWEWELEKHYHHIFTSDTSIIDLARQVDFPMDFSRPITSTLTSTGIYQLDSPLSLLKFPDLSLFDRLRTGAGLAYLRYLAGWKTLEKYTAYDFIMKLFGNASWRVLWEPLFSGKFHDYTKKVNAAWFWARIKKRSPSLGYPRGGFSKFARKLQDSCSSLGVKFFFGTFISKVISSKNKITITHGSGTETFDRVICTLSASAFSRLAPQLDPAYIEGLRSLPFLGAVNLVLELDAPFLPENIYWLNINRPGLPFLSAVEHTNFASASHYAGSHLLYVGNYLPAGHPYYKYSPKKLLQTYLPGLKIINPSFSPSQIKNSWIWQTPFAQPVPEVNHSSRLPDVRTPLPGIFLANMQQVYPWDRGVNYAVELGQIVASLCTKNLKES